MAYFSPEESFETLKKRTADAVAGYFPMEGPRNTLEVDKVWVEDKKHPDDIRDQQDARMKGRTWAVPVKAKLKLKDSQTGKVKDTKTVTVAQLPKITRRYSHIVDGNEWQVANQLRLKSGVYTRIKDNGQLSSQWNLARGRGFDMDFNPETRKMTVKYGSSNVPLYPILKTMGVADDDIERQWGREVLEANRVKNPDAAVRQMHKAMTGKVTADPEEARSTIRETFGKTELRPDSTEITLGQKFKQVDGTSLLAGSDKLLKVSRKDEEPDDRDSLEFKDLWSAEDLIEERLSKDSRVDVRRRIMNNLNRKDKVSDIVSPDVFGKPLKSFFTNSTLSERPDQRNPVGFIVGARKTTVMGQHGIDNERKLTLEAQSINPSHLGFIDPVHTPENKRIGAVTQLSSIARKSGKDIKIPVINAQTGKRELISPRQAMRNTLAFPDQFKVGRSGVPVATAKHVKVSDENGEISTASPQDVKYILPSSKGMFDVSTNMIPFLQSDQGNRTMVAARQLEQAVPLINREAPLVQVKGEGRGTFEAAVGRFSAHSTPVAGKVERVGKDSIIVRGEDGKKHEVQTYNDFPLNDNKSVISSTPLVKKGDEVKAGQVVADSSFTKKGTTALGTNLRTAYMPYKGLNFEDGVVISESAAKKLTSEHMHRTSVRSDDNVILNKRKFLAETAGQITKEQADKLDDDGIIKPGARVMPGDVLVGEMRREELTPEQRQMALFSRKALKPVRVRTQAWDKEYPGTVSRVVKHGKNTTVYVKTATSAEVGDKIVGRHGNKGIVTSVLPDAEMPATEDGKPAEVLMNPTGVPTRINVGQVLETAAGKIAEKTGKPYVVNNFDPNNKNYVKNMRAELKKHGLDPDGKEEMLDPKTGKPMGQVLVGPQHILKLHHTAEKGIVARSRDAYTSNLTPQSGGKHGGQTMDVSGLYAMLAHGARENVREAQTYKSDMNDDFWTRLQAGESIPPPRVPFVYKKFEAMLKGAGIDVKKDGNSLTLEPLTDKGTLALSNGEIKDPGRRLRAKDATPEPGGIFDPQVTGTQWPKGKLGDKWSHIKLAERMPNPVFEKPIRALTGISEKEFGEVMAGRKELKGKTSAVAIVDALKGMDTDAELAKAEKSAQGARGATLNKANQRIRYLRALKKAGLEPKDAYTMRYVPVLPPNMRPISVQPNGDINEADVNGIYSLGIGANNTQLKALKSDKAMPEEEAHPVSESLYDSLKALTLTGMTHHKRYRSGLVEQIAGGAKGSPKEGFFQKKVIGRRQDMSMRSTIVPDPSLNLDEVALPKKAAAEIYKPFVVSRMTRMGYTPLEAQRAIKESTPAFDRALEAESRERPVLLKRDPVLHKYGVQAFRPRLVPGKTIKIHNLVTSGFNADFDGDKMSAFVPVSPKAVKEAQKMFPSNNLFSSSTGDIMYKPSHEAMQGLFKLTEMGKRTGKTFATAADAARAVKDGEIDMTDVVTIKDAAGDVKTAARAKTTTVGRLLVHNALPESVRSDKMLTDPKFKMDKRTISSTLRQVGETAKSEYSQTADSLKDLGNEFSTGMSIGLGDFVAETTDRDLIMKEAERQAGDIRKKYKDKKQRDTKLVDLYGRADKAIQAKAKAKIEASGNKMYEWVRSGARGNWDQFRQMNVAPMLVVDSKGKTVPVPITKSYGEGLDIGGYWTAMHGARMGTIGRVQGTELPGKLFKEIVNTSINQMVGSEDCDTTKGIAFNVEDKNALDRYTAKPISLGTKGGKRKGSMPAGTLVTPRVLTRLKNNKVKEVVVRSPMKCNHADGICQKCAGLNEDGTEHALGTNIGIIAAQALGEPTTQMAMNAFHEGGVAGARGSSAVDRFARITQLMDLPHTLPGAATLAGEAGKVEKIEKDPAGGWGVHVGGKRHFVSARRDLAVKKGQEVRKGDALSSGVKNPRELLPLTNISAVQRYISDELTKTYDNPSPLHRRNTEVVVRALTNLSQVNDPGDNKDLLQGDYVPTSAINSFNTKLGKTQAPVHHTPILKGTNVMPNEMQTDWLARMQATKLKDTLLDGAAKGWRSNIHGTHPVPAMAYGKELGMGTEDAPWLN